MLIRVGSPAPAVIVQGPGELSVLEWNPVDVSCVVSGVPLPRVTWLAPPGLQTDTLTEENNLISTLSLKGLPPRRYPLTCQVSNGVGGVQTADGILSVQPGE